MQPRGRIASRAALLAGAGGGGGGPDAGAGGGGAGTPKIVSMRSSGGSERGFLHVPTDQQRDYLRRHSSERHHAAAAAAAPRAVHPHHEQGLVQFNLDPSKGVRWMQAHGLFRADADARTLASFFKAAGPGLSKKKLGEFLGKAKRAAVLKAYVALFDFAGLTLEAGLRALLRSFRLPGEAQQIDRVLEAFAEAFTAQNAARRNVFAEHFHTH